MFTRAPAARVQLTNMVQAITHLAMETVLGGQDHHTLPMASAA
ncbi:MAG TPA: hypothetical protein VH761_07585 [Ilumatobacteraceae bacterium]|jgi:hypothetical protein